MSHQEYIVWRSACETAQNQKDDAWFATVYEKGIQTLKEGGVIKIEQEFSDASSEVIKIIDNKEQLVQYLQQFSNQF
ncbi:MAG: hypothetical protein KQH63_17675 [Desulfobulbaceae bacterium]|nr:hypothetical protein [Desulfobulbaceae bacterium]